MPVSRGKCFRTRLSPVLERLGDVFPILVSAAVICLQPVAKLAASPASLEYEVKAAFLLNFTRFVEWPPASFATPDSPLTVCILGDDPFGRGIDQIVEGESVNGHKIVVERIRRDQQRSCHVVYVSANAVWTSIPETPVAAVLTVGEGDQFIHEGGMIAFVVDNRRVRFDINLKAASTAGLKLSSKLLQVARAVDK